jgi:hypothetical protein
MENHLKKLSQISKRNEDIYHTWEVIKLEIVKLLENVSVHFPHFSMHNSSHSETICTQIDRLLGEERILQLSISDTIMMLMAFYCHDLGMSLVNEEIYEFFKGVEYHNHIKLLSEDKTNPLSTVAESLLDFHFNANGVKDNEFPKSVEIYNNVIIIIQDYFRKNHAIKSANKIREHLVNKLQIDRTLGIRFVNTLCDICELHQKDINNIMIFPQRTNGISDDYMHPRLVGSMLCLGDLLDLDTDRFNKYYMESVIPMLPDSKLHLKKHESVKHFLVCTDSIELISDCESIDVYRLMRDWISWIENAIDFISLNWSLITPKDFGNAPYFIKKDLYLKGNTNWTEYSDLKFNISQKRAIELLQGANIYKSKFVFLREIIQNAIDSSLLLLLGHFVQQ